MHSAIYLDRPSVCKLATVLVLLPVFSTRANAHELRENSPSPPAQTGLSRKAALDILDPWHVEHGSWTISQIDAALKKAPKSSALILDRAVAYGRDGDYHQSMADVDRALAIDPLCARAYLVRARLYQSSKSWRQAFADLETAAKLGRPPISLAAMKYSAFLHRELHQYDIGLKEYTKVIDSGRLNQKQKAYTVFQRGELYARINKPDPALVDYNLAVKLDPALNIVYLMRARLYASGEKAQDTLQKALQKALVDYTHFLDCNKMPLPGQVGSQVVSAYRERAAIYERTGHPELAKRDRLFAEKCQQDWLDLAPFRTLDKP